MRILIIRHADPEYHGDTLTEHGHKEAAALATRLCRPKEAGQGLLTKIYTSPMGRAKDTAGYTERESGLKAEVLEWTRELTYWPKLACDERPGEGGLALWDVSGEDVRAVGSLTAENQYEKVPSIAPAKKPYEELRAQSDAFLKNHGYERQPNGVYKIVERNRDTIAVFCHGGFGATWMAHLLDIPLAHAWSGFYLAPSSVTTILMDERSTTKAVPRAIGVSDLSHLYAADLTTQVSKYEKPNRFGSQARPSGIKANYF